MAVSAQSTTSDSTNETSTTSLMPSLKTSDTSDLGGMMKALIGLVLIMCELMDSFQKELSTVGQVDGSLFLVGQTLSESSNYGEISAMGGFDTWTESGTTEGLAGDYIEGINDQLAGGIETSSSAQEADYGAASNMSQECENEGKEGLESLHQLWQADQGLMNDLLTIGEIVGSTDQSDNGQPE